MSSSRDTAASVHTATHGATRAWAAVAVLALVGTLNYIDRFLPSVLAEPIKRELALSDTAIGLINGFGFLIVYAVLGIVIARVADRGMFGAVVAGCLTLWGSMTMLGGTVQSGLQLALTRVGVAVGEAGSTPAAHAYVARNFVPEKWSAPLAVITMSVPLASAASLLGGLNHSAPGEHGCRVVECHGAPALLGSAAAQRRRPPAAARPRRTAAAQRPDTPF